MRNKVFIAFLLSLQLSCLQQFNKVYSEKEESFSPQYDTVYIEKEEVDINNRIYKPGSVFVYDYEIIENGRIFKLNANTESLSIYKYLLYKYLPFYKGYPEGKFNLVEACDDTLKLKIHLCVVAAGEKEKTNKNETEICYLYEPISSSWSQTGIVENQHNVWMHPPRLGFFRALETCPFPFVKLPVETGIEWNDQMKIGDHWTNEKWGEWRKKLLLNYTYKVTSKRKVKTGIGELDCYVIESTADTEIGRSKLTGYYNKTNGFVRLEYEMFTGLKVNLWLHNRTIMNFTDKKGFIKYLTTRAQKEGILRRR